MSLLALPRDSRIGACRGSVCELTRASEPGERQVDQLGCASGR
jgi:hypothetical protein